MQQAITLVALNELIKNTLDTQLSPTYWVIAEIGELREAVKGHAYLDLIEKSDGGILAKIRGNIWSYTYQAIKRKFEAGTNTRLKSGMKILALVNVQFHELYGISLVIKDIDPNFSLGERARKRQEILDQLKSEGLLDLNKQFVLPKVSQKIAIISSVTAAGYGDFINQLEQNANGYRVHYRFFQASMQGKDAPKEIIRSIQEVEKLQIEARFDLLVLIRGGGAQTDLDCFDDYDLAKTIANAALPIVTGIGHERDESIADIVAHTRLKTPTAVASFILSGFQEYEDMLRRQMLFIERYTQKTLKNTSDTLVEKVHLLKNLFQGKISEKKNNLDQFSRQSYRLSLHALEKMQLKVETNQQSLKKATYFGIQKAQGRLDQHEKAIQRADPEYLLARGYTRTEKEGIPIHLTELKTGDTIVTFSQETIITSQIKKLEKNE
ncbi:exodeoxyribonuclease VII large subunit [Cyclobacterium jeungdonense]|uniref:Exodeoxyribonuclease 7 large subunit n=1 Tax=Cyclobacterium jeungdonense TaxID=708087 RepID=A0ABT8CF19_9BACT|nr:exodeoxyribonuclease VII large subunit [Cyclobacterium jeungdonense]MDN3690271.1 exodeoxyribonuclease VII large subunit [Cyclobacterium jeungdonense]